MIKNIAEQKNLLALNAAIEEQTAAMDEIANTSEKLAKLAVDMQTAVSRFKF